MKLRVLVAAVIFSSVTIVSTLTHAQGPQEPPALEKKETMRVRIGGKQMAAQLVHKVAPVYPQKARKERVEGKVLLHVIIAKDGKLQQIEVISGPDLLRQSALDAVRKWEYRPTLLNGKPVEVDTSIEVIYSLSQ